MAVSYSAIRTSQISVDPRWWHAYATLYNIISLSTSAMCVRVCVYVSHIFYSRVYHSDIFVSHSASFSTSVAFVTHKIASSPLRMTQQRRWRESCASSNYYISLLQETREPRLSRRRVPESRRVSVDCFFEINARSLSRDFAYKGRPRRPHRIANLRLVRTCLRCSRSNYISLRDAIMRFRSTSIVAITEIS